MKAKPRHIGWYGWQPDLPDHRDKYIGLSTRVLAALPPSVDLRTACPPVYDQGQLGCHSADTEVLTNSGWKPWPSLNGRELLGTVHPETSALEFQAPIALQAYRYSGPMYEAEHRSADFIVTPNHRMWHHTETSKRLRFATADSLPSRYAIPYATSGHKGVNLESVRIGARVMSGDDFLALVAVVVSDGYATRPEGRGGRVAFCGYGASRDDVAALAQRVGARPQDDNNWVMSDSALAEWFIENCGHLAPNKHIPGIVFDASEQQIRRFLDFFGDKTTRPDGTRQFCSTSRAMLDDIQRLLLQVGKRGSICRRNVVCAPTEIKGRAVVPRHPVGFVTEHKKPSAWFGSRDSSGTLRKDSYDGDVFCATVPNGLLITRRNDATLISGNSCTANAIAGGLQFDQMRQKQSDVFVPSRLFIYFNERLIEHTVRQDAGAMIRDGIKSVAKDGAPHESLWPYTISKFTTKPSTAAYTDAKKHPAILYQRVTQSLDQLKGCLASGFPFVFGFTVYESFESDAVAKTGKVPMPKPGEGVLGGHAVLAVGYDDSQSRFIVRNSWGTGWGLKGYFTMPYAYLTDNDLADDFWTVKQV